MKKYSKLFLVVFLLTATGCATVGKDFNFFDYNYIPLEIGKSTPDDAYMKIGDPMSKSTSVKDGANYETFKYLFSGSQTKVLIAEFKEGLLNAYVAMILKQETPLFVANEIELIVEGKSNKEFLENMFGKPQGKAVCLSLLPDYRNLCKKGDEVWRWYGQDNKKQVTLSVVFDDKGIVSYVERKDSD